MSKIQVSKKNAISPKTLLLFVVSVVVFFVLLSAVINLGKKYISLREKLRELESEKAALQQKQAELGEENAYLKTKEGEERILREKYQLVRPGEGLIIITEPDPLLTESEVRKRSIGKFWDTLLKALGIRD